MLQILLCRHLGSLAPLSSAPISSFIPITQLGQGSSESFPRTLLPLLFPPASLRLADGSFSGCHFKSFFSYCWCEQVAVPRLPLLLLGTRLGVLSMEVSLLCHPDVPSRACWVASSPQLRATLLPAPGEPLRCPQPPACAPQPHRWGTCPGCRMAITPHLFCTGRTKA